MELSVTKNEKRVAVFIDHSNVVHRLSDLRKIDKNWIRWYNPLELSKKLAGNRKLVRVYFYCSPPPSYFLQDGPDYESRYWQQMSYYNEVSKLPDVELKYAQLKGVKGDLHEKNLDTQLTTDLIVKSATNEFDIAIIVSNDGDFVSAAEAVKTQYGRKIELVYFRKNSSMELRTICDVSRRARMSHFIQLNFVVNNGSLI